MTILCYHAVSETWPNAYSVTPAQLEAQVRSMLSRGYRPATFTSAVTTACSGKVVAVTFDDAFRSVFTIAHPILARLGVTATVFAPTRFVEDQTALDWDELARWRDGPFGRELDPMTWDDLRALRAGGWEIGSHSVSHPRLTTLGDDDLHRELHESRDLCRRRIGSDCVSLAYPYGDVDRRVEAAAAGAGYIAAASVYERTVDSGPLRHPRVSVLRSDERGRFALKTSRPFRAIRGSAAWPLVARAFRRP